MNLYVAVVLDLFSRRIVSWSMSAAMTAEMVTNALMIAVWREGRPRLITRTFAMGGVPETDRTPSKPAFDPLRSQCCCAILVLYRE